jgi:hypothetical protein
MEEDLAAFFAAGGAEDRAAFFKAFAALLEEKAEVERERIARDEVVDALLKRRAETKATIAELVAIMKAIELRPIEKHPSKTLAEFQSEAARKRAAVDQQEMEKWLSHLASRTNVMRDRNPTLTDSDVLDKIEDEPWPAGIFHPTRERMVKGMTILNKAKRITRRRR